jgi:hypothetical protein
MKVKNSKKIGEHTTSEPTLTGNLRIKSIK